MRFRLEATPEELREKASQLVERLAKALDDVRPDIADVLEKSLPVKDTPELKFAMLRELKERSDKEYRKTLDAILKDVGKVLDKAAKENMAKSYVEGVLDEEERVYKYIKGLVLRRTEYTEKDFEEGEALYGKSGAELLDVVEAARD